MYFPIRNDKEHWLVENGNPLRSHKHRQHTEGSDTSQEPEIEQQEEGGGVFAFRARRGAPRAPRELGKTRQAFDAKNLSFSRNGN
jgi:hypothetical protein